MSQLHFTLQGKGGIGKSFVAGLLAQYYLDSNRAVLCLDADPVSQTLSAYPRLGARRLAFDAFRSADSTEVAALTEELLAAEADVIVDSAAALFPPLWEHLVQHDALRTFVAAGQAPVIHIVFAAGPALSSLLEALASLLELIPDDVQVVLWRNDYFGSVTMAGNGIEELPQFQRVRGRIFAILRLPGYTSSALRHDVARMLERRLTFDEAARSTCFHLVTRQRLMTLKRKLFTQMALLP